jgi:NAD(P)-dependent dehydrogenase (short-subunit alcohol dehydrogenase family)
MDLGIEGKVAFVAAASKGLGRAVAEELAREGASLVLCARNAENLNGNAPNAQQRFGINKSGAARNERTRMGTDFEHHFNHRQTTRGQPDVIEQPARSGDWIRPNFG